MTEEQKRIINSFPEKDRGIFKEGEGIVEQDPLEAAVKKLKIKNKEKAERRRVRLENGEEDKEEEYDSDDLVGSDEEEEYDDEDYGDEEASQS